MMNSSTIFLATTTIIIVIPILIMTSGTGTLSSPVFAQNDSEDSETDLADLTLTNSSEVQVQVGSSGAELPQQGPYHQLLQNNLPKSLQFASITSFFNFNASSIARLILYFGFC
jgi:hypothetical protein